MTELLIQWRIRVSQHRTESPRLRPVQRVDGSGSSGEIFDVDGRQNVASLDAMVVVVLAALCSWVKPMLLIALQNLLAAGVSVSGLDGFQNVILEVRQGLRIGLT